jgi:hypothetical protein
MRAFCTRTKRRRAAEKLTVSAIASFRSETAVEMKVFIVTAALVLVTWLLYKLAEGLAPRK